ncbi:MAG: histidine kinase [Puia sp.]|nr:histidine kinase [Puia sp.]
MEYDNDRIKKPPPRAGNLYWLLLALLGPLTNSTASFPTDGPGWFLAFLTGGLVLPFYIAYSHIMGTVFLVQKRNLLSALMSLLSFLVILVFIFTLYSLYLKFDLRPVERVYLGFGIRTGVREGLWVIVNMCLSLVIFYIHRTTEEKDLLAAIQKDNAFLKLRYLRAQLNPHFLFNTLNSIYSLSLQKSDRAPEVVIKLADIMRYLIYECNQERIPLEKEIAFIRNYIEIEKTRHQADIRFTVEGETAGIEIEPFMFISFIENGFKHAMDNSFDEPFIYITLKISEDTLVLNVVNSTSADLGTQAKRMYGKGITHSRSLLELLYPDSYSLDIIQTDREEARRSSIRMRNARERLESLYPDSYTLDVILNKNAFTVSLILRSILRVTTKPGLA